MTGHDHDIVVIGASTGGIEALSRLIKDLPENLAASVFIVQHISPLSPGFLTSILSKAGKIKVVEAVNNAKIEKGCVYVAPPDNHLLLKKDNIKFLTVFKKPYQYFKYIYG